MAEQAIALPFAETTKGKSAKWNQKGFIYGATATSAVLSNTANNLTSYFFGYTSGNTSKPRNHFMNKKIMCGIDIDVAYADVAATLVLEGSYNNTDWVTIATLDSDTTPNVAGVQTYLADLTDVYFPYVRLNFNASGLNCGTDGTLKFIYGIPVPEPRDRRDI